jgi:hypothetical protein
MARGNSKDAAEPGPGTPPRFFEFLGALSNREVDFVLIGGLAVSLHGYVRATRGIDIVVEPSRENMRRLWDALVELRARPTEFAPHELPLPFERDAFIDGDGNWALYTMLGRIDIIRYVETADGEIAYSDLRAHAEQVTLDEIGAPIRVASASDLIAMKEHANRDIDRIDLTALRMAHGQEE